MYKTIQNDNTGVIHVAYGVNHPITHCGAVNSYSENIHVQRFDTRVSRNKAVTCQNCLRMLSTYRERNRLPGLTMNTLTACKSNIMDNIKTFVKLCPDCDFMITNRMEPTYKCRHADNKIGTCEWVFCPLQKVI